MRLMGSANRHRCRRVRPLGQLVGDAALQRVGGGEIELRVHAQRQHPGGNGRKLPQVAVAQAAVGVQTDFNDAWVQALEQKVAQVHQDADQHPPVQARRGGQRQAKGGQANDRLDA